MSHSLLGNDHEPATGEEHHAEAAPDAITVTFSVATSAFELGRAMADAPITWIEFEPAISIGELRHSQFWAETADSDALETALCDVSSIRILTSVTHNDSQTLFEVEWAAPIEGLLGHLQTFDARVVDITGTSDVWRFVCRFPSGEQLTAFHDACLDDGITVKLTRVRQ